MIISEKIKQKKVFLCENLGLKYIDFMLFIIQWLN